MNSSFSENETNDFNKNDNNKKKIDNFKSFKDLFNHSSNLDDFSIQTNIPNNFKIKYDINIKEVQVQNKKEIKKDLKINVNELNNKENIIQDFENRLAKRNSLNNINKYFSVYENKNTIDFDEFPIDGNALKSIVIEFGLNKANIDENVNSNNNYYNNNDNLNLEIRKYVKNLNTNDTIIKLAYNKLKTDFLKECDEKISKCYYSYIKHNNSSSDNSSVDLKMNKGKNYINFFELKNKDFLFNSNNSSSKEYNLEILQYTNYYQTVNSLYKKFVEGKIKHFYIVSLFMTCYFVNETYIDSDNYTNNNKDNNNIINKNNNNINRKNLKLRLYISEYYKSLENNLKDSNIEFTKISNDNLIEKIRNQEAKEKKAVSLQNLESNSFSDMEKFFANTNDFIDDNMTSLISLKGVNMNLFFNLFINGSQSKGFIIFSDSLFSNSVYSENIMKEVETRDLKVKLRMYGCFFPSDMINIKDIIESKSSSFVKILKDLIFNDITKNSKVLSLLNKITNNSNENILTSKLQYDFKTNLSKKTTNIDIHDNENNTILKKSEINDLLNEISNKIAEEVVLSNSINCYIELNYLDRIKRYFILNKQLSGSIKKIHYDCSNQQNKYKVLIN